MEVNHDLLSNQILLYYVLFNIYVKYILIYTSYTERVKVWYAFIRRKVILPGFNSQYATEDY